MKRADLKVIVGGAEADPGKFLSGFVTDTRLMGVMVIYLHYYPDLHQYFYIETTEYGFETYRSAGEDESVTLFEIEDMLMGGLGGNKVDITEREAKILLQQYSKVTVENGYDLPEGKSGYSFLLNDTIIPTSEERRELFFKTCVPMQNDNQLINYFLMRYLARDFEAIMYLSQGDLDTSFMPDAPSELCYNSIETVSGTYMCEALVEDGEKYQIYICNIETNGDEITSFNVKSRFPISQVEAAMKLGRTEFIDVYECLSDKDSIKEGLRLLYPGALKNAHDYGILFISFKDNNNHVAEKVFRLNDDVKALFYVTEYGQLIVVSYSAGIMDLVERELGDSVLKNQIFMDSRYEFKEAIFYEFMNGNYVDFAEFMDYINE